MKVKTQNIMRTIAVKGSATIRMDRASGMTQLVITKKPGATFVVGRTPGSQLERFTESDVINTLENNSLYVISWS